MFREMLTDVIGVMPGLGRLGGVAVLVLLAAAVVILLNPWIRERCRAWAGQGGWRVTLSILFTLLNVLLVLVAVIAVSSRLTTLARDFGASHGRVSETNRTSVERIWGRPHVQNALSVALSVERIRDLAPDELIQSLQRVAQLYGTRTESGAVQASLPKGEELVTADGLKAVKYPGITPIVMQQRVSEPVPGEAITGEDHAVSLKMNYRQKGTAYYTGYEENARFAYDIVNPADTEVEAAYWFPLQQDELLYDGLQVVVDDKPVVDASVSLEGIRWQEKLPAGAKRQVVVSLHTRGLDFYTYQPGDGRPLSRFAMKLSLAGVAKERLNYPEGCMSPTLIRSAGKDVTELEWKLADAVTSGAMGVTLPARAQPGQEVFRAIRGAPWCLGLLIALLAAGLLLLTGAVEVLPLLLTVGCWYALYALMAGLADVLPFFRLQFLIAWVATALPVWLMWRRVHPGQAAGRFAGICFAAMAMIGPLTWAWSRDSQTASNLIVGVAVVIPAWIYLALKRRESR